MEPSALVAEVRERGLLEDAADLCAELEPDVAQPFGRALVGELVRPDASDGGDRPLELADDVGDRDLLRRPREPSPRLIGLTLILRLRRRMNRLAF